MKNGFIGWKVIMTLGKKTNLLTSWKLLSSLNSEEPNAVLRAWCCACTAGRQKDSPDLFYTHSTSPPLSRSVEMEEATRILSGCSLGPKHSIALKFSVLIYTMFQQPGISHGLGVPNSSQKSYTLCELLSERKFNFFFSFPKCII